MLKILGTGIYAPGEPINNSELKTLAGIEFDSEKLEIKMGIKSRHNARLRGIKESTVDFAEKASLAALQDAGLTAEDIDLIILGTDTPEYISPATAILVQGRLKKRQDRCLAIDVLNTCASFVSGIDVAARMLTANPALRHVLLVAPYNMPAFVRPGDAFGYSIFGDAAGAWIVGRGDGMSRYIDSEFIADGTEYGYIGVYSGGARKQITHELLDKGEWGLELLQPLPARRNVEMWPPLVRQLLAKTNIPIEKVDHFLFTQINRSAIVETMQILGVPMEKTTCIMDRYGYPGAACVPLALHHAVQQKSIKRGDMVLNCVTGSGYTIGASVFVY